MTFPLTRSRSRARFFGTPFSPVSLFANGEQGAWYDPSDLTTLFQDAAGTTPTTMETRVRLMLDKSKGLVLGPELVTNGSNLVNTTGWTPIQTAVLSAVNGALRINSSTPFDQARQTLTLVIGRTYVCTYTVGSIPNNEVYAALASTNGGLKTAAGTYSFYFTATSINTVLSLIFTGTGDVDFSNISVRELPGNHATAPSDADSPILRARYNLLTYSEEFDNAAWAKENASSSQTTATADPLGGLTAETLVDSSANSRHIIYQQLNASFNVSRVFSVYAKQNTLRYLAISVPLAGDADCYSAIFDLQDGVVSATRANGNGTVSAAIQSVGNGWYRCSMTGTIASSGTGNFFPMLGTSDRPGFTGSLSNNNMPAYSGTGQSLYIWGADLRLTADTTLNIPAYQRVGNGSPGVFDYDTNGFPPYLRFETDDSFSTASIDFSGTPQMTVFAGVTKLSDATTAILAELSANGSSNNGAFLLTAPDTASVRYGLGMGGTSFVAVTTSAAAYNAPVTNVITGIGNIATPETTWRANGVQVLTSSTTLGTGNFGNYPLFIGRRNNSTLPFNGRIYSLIIRGASTTTPLIASTEQWVAGKMRLPI